MEFFEKIFESIRMMKKHICEGKEALSWWETRRAMTRSSRSQMFFKIGVLGNIVNFTGKHLYSSHFLIKACNFIKKRLRDRCFPVNFAKFLRTPFFTEHLQWLLLNNAVNNLSNTTSSNFTSLSIWLLCSNNL